MKKLLLLSAVLVLISSFYRCQNTKPKILKEADSVKVKNDWQEDNLKGRVKSFTAYEYSAKDSFG